MIWLLKFTLQGLVCIGARMISDTFFAGCIAGIAMMLVFTTIDAAVAICRNANKSGGAA